MVTLCSGCVCVEHHVDQRMAGFVPGGKFLILIGHRQAAAFAAPAHLVARFFEFGHADGLLVGPGGQQRGFVEQVGQFGAGDNRACPAR